MRNYKKELNKDLIIIAAGILPALFLTYLLSYYRNEINMLSNPIFDLPLLFFMFLTVVISFFEAKSNDPFVTGKTQSLGVNNSFTGAFALVIIFSKDMKTCVITYVIMSILLLSARHLGRKYHESKNKNIS